MSTNWIDVTGQGHIQQDSSGQQYSAVPVPGTLFGHASAASTTGFKVCTLGPAVVAAGRTGFLTAGHCTEGAASMPQMIEVSPTESQALGTEEQVQDQLDDAGLYSDSGVIWTSPIDPQATTIAGSWPVAGSMSVKDVTALPDGTPICFDGAISGVQCGGKDSGENDRILFDAVSRNGDSGAPVFVVDSYSRRATLIGILKGGNAVSTTATYLAPALERLGAQAITSN